MEVNPKLSEKARQDLVLVNAATEGNEEAFSQLHEKYYNNIYFLILKMVGNTSDAEDLTSEAFAKAFRHIDKYVPNYAFSSWLFKIATNNAIDFIRKKKMGVVDYSSQPYAQAEIVQNNLTINLKEPDPEEKLIRTQSIERLWQIIDQLKPQYRLLVIMRYFEEFSYEEIAVALQLPMGTVKAQLFRARNLLHDLLKNQNQI